MNDYVKNREWANRYNEGIKEILKENLMHVISINIAPDAKDMKCATDLIISVNGGDVATRIRRAKYSFRDFTVRSISKHNLKTELNKLREGFANWYLYLWTTDTSIDEWVLIDLNLVRKSGLLNDGRKSTINKDKTGFIAIKLWELINHKCIIKSKVRESFLIKPIPEEKTEVQKTLDNMKLDFIL